MIEERIEDYQEWFKAIQQTSKVLQSLKPNGNVHTRNLLVDYLNELQSDRESLQRCIEHDLIDGSLSEECRRILEELAFEVDIFRI